MSDQRAKSPPTSPNSPPESAKPVDPKAPTWSSALTPAPTQKSIFQKAQPFVVGGIAGCVATTCIQPIDMVKVRLQLVGESGVAGASKSPFKMAGQIVSNDGFLSLYKGLDAGLIRQITYTTARLGLFRVTSEYLKGDSDKPLSLSKKAGAGLFAGAAASLVGNPADLALIRLQADNTLPLAERRNYTGVFNALSRIVKDEGVVTLWRGATPTIVRAAMLNMGMLASFDQSKEQLANLGWTGWKVSLGASAISGFFAVTLSLPFDFMKTRIQKMKPDPVTGVMPYKNMWDVGLKTLRAEGLRGLYVGYPTYYFRIAPHAMITLMMVDYMNGLLAKKNK